MSFRNWNGAVVLTIGLPLFAIAASVGTAVVAFTRGDSTLPDEYHWEGQQLDRDFTLAQRAAALNVHAKLVLLQGNCRVTLSSNGDPPSSLRLELIHATRPELDRHTELQRVGQSYEGPCAEIPAAHWHVELIAANGAWSIRQEVMGSLDDVNLGE